MYSVLVCSQNIFKSLVTHKNLTQIRDRFTFSATSAGEHMQTFSVLALSPALITAFKQTGFGLVMVLQSALSTLHFKV